MRIRAVLAGVLFVGMGFAERSFPAEAAKVSDLKGEEIRQRIASDQKAVATFRKGMQAVVQFGASRPDLFPPKKLSGLRTLNREAKEEIWGAWKRLMDYSLALESIARVHSTYFLLKDRDLREASFGVTHAAFVAQYRFAMEFIRLADTDSGLDVLLDDPVQELGLPKESYSKFKLAALNAGRATEFGALSTVAALMPKRTDPLAKDLAEDKDIVWKMGLKEGQALTAENALDVIRNAGQAVWYPIQAGAAVWMGDTKVWRKDLCLITQEQLQAVLPKLEPGDILLERREWYMSNIGLPGFWPHAMLFVSTPEARKAFFDDPEVKEWVKAQGQADGDFERLLQERYPDAYAQGIKPEEDGHVPRILEAVGEGVVFSALEHSGAADSLCGLRPRLTKKERAVAIFRSLLYFGRPYDLNFDFMTDSAIVCTELVYKSYQPCPDSRGLKFPLLNILGRLATPANELVKQLDETYGTAEQPYDMVVFLDGHEKEKKAVDSTVEELRKSWHRPKWHVVMPPEPVAKP